MFKTLIEIRKLKHYQESKVDDTITLYEMQMKAIIFNGLKQHYIKSSTFKANQMMKICKATLNAWRDYTVRNNMLREKQD
jgi:hypothetical protein